jgi:hypothetical protein
LVVGLLRLGLDGSLHPALGDVRGDGAGPAHGSPVARIWNPVHLDRIGQIGTYWYVPVRTGTTWYKAVRESHGRTYRYVLVHTSTYTQEDKLFPDSSRKSQKR